MSRSSFINRWTNTVSAPFERKYEAASKVRDPVRNVKLFVSTIIPASNAVASSIFSFKFFGWYSSNSVTSSAVEDAYGSRSEEHTSELQSRFDLVCRLLLEKKNIK